MREQFESIDKYIDTFPPNVRTILKKMRQTIRSAAPSAIEAIRYGMPTFRLNDKNLVHFAALKNHLGFYPTPSGVTAFDKDLTPYKTSKGAVQFPLAEPIPFGLVARITKFRVREVETSKNAGLVKSFQPVQRKRESLN